MMGLEDHMFGTEQNDQIGARSNLNTIDVGEDVRKAKMVKRNSEKPVFQNGGRLNRN